MAQARPKCHRLPAAVGNLIVKSASRGAYSRKGAILAGDEDAPGAFCVVAGVSLIDIGPLDRTAGEGLGAVDDIPQGVTVVGVVGQRPGMQHEQAAGSTAIVGDDGSLHAELVGG